MNVDKAINTSVLSAIEFNSLKKVEQKTDEVVFASRYHRI